MRVKKCGISTDMAMRLGKFFGTTPEFWMNLQNAYELAMACKALAGKLEMIRPHRGRAA